MAHLSKEKGILIARIKRIIGQLNTVVDQISDEKECGTILQIVASCRGAINGLTVEILEDHIRSHIIETKNTKSERNQAALEVIGALKSYVK